MTGSKTTAKPACQSNARAYALCTVTVVASACTSPTIVEPDLSRADNQFISAVNIETPGTIPVDLNILGDTRDPADVRDALFTVNQIYAQCDVTIDTHVQTLADAPARELDLQTLYALTHKHVQRRPTVFVIDSTAENDLAFSYLPSLNRDVSGTAWISSRVSERCLGWITAHEIGHILLDSSHHHDDPQNVMNARCSRNTVGRASTLPRWTAEQCQALRQVSEQP